ncbi:DNA topoisomerase I [Desulfurococcus mucosus]|uniref:DNA topoisomerase I n=1 Tax=Desulfurococcus mucosus TaxID=2275 RepID=UPI000B05ED94|nr:DNA topoisomerase I [Desulfurococcus mucosus]
MSGVEPWMSRGVRIWDLKGRVLVIAEKPKAARKIAEALSPGYVTRRIGSIPVYEINAYGSMILVASSVGHLYELNTGVKGYPVYSYEWVPSHLVNPGKRHAREYLEVLKKLCRGVDYYVNACDYDIEGSVIGYLIIKFNGDEEKALRAKFSSLTREELRQAFNNLAKLDYEMIEAGLCRHELDWLWGINVSRALMKAVEDATGRRIVLSAGRVQTPTLKYVVEKTVERNLFIPLPQYRVTVTAERNGEEVVLEYAGNPVEKHGEARSIVERVRRQGYLIVEEVEGKTYVLKPPPPFNLGDLQEEAARIYGFSPAKTQAIAEQLYLDALISYPRTNSQKLPPTLNYRGILDNLASIGKYSGLVASLLSETRGVLKPVEGEKEDPAHPAIYPTGMKPGGLTDEQWAVYDLIVRRFLAVFAQPARLTHYTVKAVTPSRDAVFKASWQRVEEQGWMKYYGFHTYKSSRAPGLVKGDKLGVVKVSMRESYTKPPKRLSKIDVLRWMESVEIGTEATRAQIIEKLFERKYLFLESKGIGVSDLGFGVVEVVERFFPDLLSIELTRRFEKEMDAIRRGLRSRGQVLEEAKRILTAMLGEFDENRVEAGRQLAVRLGVAEPSRGKCRISSCKREAVEEGLCRHHASAARLIHEYYVEWSRRKEIGFDEYVEKLRKSRNTGKWIKEVIEAGVVKAPRFP